MRIYALSFDWPNFTVHIQLLRSLKPHQAPVVVTAVDSTGTLLATGGADSVIKVWDIRGGYITHTFHGHSGLISALHFFQVDAASQIPQQQALAEPHRFGPANSSNLHDDTIAGFRLASGGEDGKVRVWNLLRGKSIATLDSHVSVVRKLDYSPEENALLSASRDQTIMVTDLKSWKNRWTIPALEELDTAGFLAKGSIFYTGGEFGNVRLWSMDTGKEITRQQLTKTEIETIHDSVHYPDLNFLLTVHADQTLIFHSIGELNHLSGPGPIDPPKAMRRICGNYGQILGLAYIGQDQSLLAINSNSEDVQIISLTASEPTGTESGSFFGSEVCLLKGHDDVIVAMDVDWSGHWLVTGSKDNNARLWRLDPVSHSFSCYASLTGHTGSIPAVALPHYPPSMNAPAVTNPLEHPPSFLVTGSDDRTIKCWEISISTEISKQQRARALYTRKAHEKDINALAIHASGKFFATASHDRLVKIWAVQDGSTVGILRGHRRGVWTVAFSPPSIHLTAIAPNTSSNRGYVLTGSGDHTIRIWTMADFACVLTLEGHTNPVHKVIWLPSIPDAERPAHDKRGVLVASGGADKLVKIWDLGSGECAATLDGHSDRVWTLTARAPGTNFSAAGESLVSGAADGVLTFWKDTTAVTAARTVEEEIRRLETDQSLQNMIHGRKYRDAIVLALQLDQPTRLLSLFKSVAESSSFEQTSFTGSLEVDAVLADLADEQLYRLLLRCRDWNTNTRSAMIAQRVLRTIVRSYNRERLASLNPPKDIKIGKGQTVAEILEGLRVWSERHFERVSELWDESFMVEFVLGEMGEYGGTNGVQNGISHGKMSNGIANT
jgi:U3 small nucleolar RNA-associated protein 13